MSWHSVDGDGRHRIKPCLRETKKLTTTKTGRFQLLFIKASDSLRVARWLGKRRDTLQQKEPQVDVQTLLDEVDVVAGYMWRERTPVEDWRISAVSVSRVVSRTRQPKRWMRWWRLKRLLQWWLKWYAWCRLHGRSCCCNCQTFWNTKWLC